MDMTIQQSTGSVEAEFEDAQAGHTLTNTSIEVKHTTLKKTKGGRKKRTTNNKEYPKNSKQDIQEFLEKMEGISTPCADLAKDHGCSVGAIHGVAKASTMVSAQEEVAHSVVGAPWSVVEQTRIIPAQVVIVSQDSKEDECCSVFAVQDVVKPSIMVPAPEEVTHLADEVLGSVLEQTITAPARVIVVSEDLKLAMDTDTEVVSADDVLPLPSETFAGLEPWS